MHPGYAENELRTRQDHGRTPKDIVRDVQNDEYDMPDIAVSHPDDF
jgi:hypothetical protein